MLQRQAGRRRYAEPDPGAYPGAPPQEAVDPQRPGQHESQSGGREEAGPGHRTEEGKAVKRPLQRTEAGREQEAERGEGEQGEQGLPPLARKKAGQGAGEGKQPRIARSRGAPGQGTPIRLVERPAIDARVGGRQEQPGVGAGKPCSGVGRRGRPLFESAHGPLRLGQDAQERHQVRRRQPESQGKRQGCPAQRRQDRGAPAA